jgi:formamidopyrimidine-DNA glycosylase
MPELPEVTTIVTDLNKYISGHIIKKAVVAKDYNVLPENDTFISQVTNKKVVRVFRVAKNILMELDDSNFILTHLAMTGRLLLRDPSAERDQWIRVVYVLEKQDDRSIKHLRFTDVRMFGKTALINTTELEQLRQKYGPEPIKPSITPEEFLSAITSKKTNIKNALLDQKVVSGLGNIYATDALFIAGIHPMTKTAEINLATAAKLLRAAQDVLNEGIANRGSTLSDKMYVDIFGKEGNQQEHFRIYSKLMCPTCGGKVEVLNINGRGTYFCPTCQPLSK